ncbi:uncharacterized protein LOC143039599 isoform X2 [Oratosquilla oratoria]|uniref:uncharacterized protein LOC143039599 isoform X2 n=1 Tax=Oratosquilla oratoria TaxID=337810 RepID=UPI003F76346E
MANVRLLVMLLLQIHFCLGHTGKICRDPLPSFCKCRTHIINCDCEGQDLNLTSSGIRTVVVQNCGRVNVSSNTFEKIKDFMNFTAVNVNTLTLSKQSFFISSGIQTNKFRIICNLINTTVQQIPKDVFTQESSPHIHSGIKQSPLISLNIAGCTVNLIETDAMKGVRVKQMILENSIFKDIKANSFHFNLEGNLTIVDSHFLKNEPDAFTFKQTYPSNSFTLLRNNFTGPVSNAFVGDIAGQVIISNNNFSHVIASPWNLSTSNYVDIKNNTFESVPAFGLKITGTSSIKIEHNIFKYLEPSAFKGLQLNGPSSSLFIANNHIHKYEARSLQFQESLVAHRSVVIRDNVIGQECSCTVRESITSGIDLANQTYQELIHSPTYDQWFKHNDCLHKEKEVILDNYHDKYCMSSNSTIIIAITVLIACITIAAVCIYFAWRRASSTREHEGPSNEGRRRPIVIPDQRTYKETEIHVVYENATAIDETDNDALEEQEESDEEKGSQEKESCRIVQATT